MTRVEEWIEALSTPGGRLRPGHPSDAVLLALVVHAAYADGAIKPEEFALLERLLPGVEPGALLTMAALALEAPMDFRALLEAIPEPADRRRLVRLAAAMVWRDQRVAREELNFVGALLEAIEDASAAAA